MSAEPVQRLERRRMSLEDYLDLPEGVRAEFVDGEVIVSPPASIPHNRVGVKLTRILEDHLPGLIVLYELGVHVDERRYRIPDLGVIERMEDGHFAEQTPVLLVEILSPSTRTEDTVRKSTEYLAAGVGQYWIVDLEQPSVTVMRNEGSEWELALALDDRFPAGEVAVGDHGVVPLDLGRLFAD